MKHGKNKYYNRSHISEAKFRQLLKCFSMDLNALSAHKISNISYRSCKVIYAKLRLHIVKFCIDQSATAGVFELDESYFGARRVRSRRGIRGRGAAGKTPVFGRLKETKNRMLRLQRIARVRR